MNIRATHFIKSSGISFVIASLSNAESLWSFVLLIANQQSLVKMEIGLDIVQWVSVFVITFYAVYKYLDLREKVMELKTYRDHEMRRIWRHISYRGSSTDKDISTIVSSINKLGSEDQLTLNTPDDLATRYKVLESSEMFKERQDQYNDIFGEWGMKKYTDVQVVD